MEAILTLIALFGVGYAGFCAFKWIVKNGQIQSGKNAPLSPTDLRVLEEAAERLMADMRIVTDECVARIEQACHEAQLKIETLESGRSLSAAPSQTTDWTPIAIQDLKHVESTLENGMESGLTNGEMELMRGLQTLGNAR